MKPFRKSKRIRLWPNDEIYVVGLRLSHEISKPHTVTRLLVNRVQ